MSTSLMTLRIIAAGIALTLSVFARAEVFDLPSDGSDVVGSITVIPAGADDTLLDIARRHGLGYEDIKRANPGVDTWIPGEGTEIVLPTRFVLPPGPRKGLILNLAEYRMYYFPEPAKGERPVVMTYPMSIGRMDWETPLGNTTIISRVTDPAWYPPASIRAEHAANGDPLPRIVPAGPKNPLGKHAMRLGLPGYLIHGTNRPAGVGMRVSHGCVRMFPEDIEFLFGKIAVKTPVRIINEPVKLGWDGDLLVMEVHQTLETSLPPEEEGESASVSNNDADDASDELSVDGPSVDEPPADFVEPVMPRDPITNLTEQFVSVTATRAGQLDWDLAEEQLGTATGIPSPVGRSIENVDKVTGIPSPVGHSIKNAATSAASE